MKVRISSDAAGSIALTPVVVREMTLEELLDYAVSVCGKDSARIHDVLARGTLVSGASRFRWEACDVPLAEIAAALARFPDPDPTLAFSAERCTLAILRGSSLAIPLTRDAAGKRRLFRRESFWDRIMALGLGAGYVNYSYREKADVYRAHITPAVQASLREASRLLAYSSLTRQLEAVAIESVDLYVTR